MRLFERFNVRTAASSQARFVARFNLWNAAVLAFSLGGFIGLIGLAPAAWMASVTQIISGERVTLTQTSGTFWRGQGTLVFNGPELKSNSVDRSSGFNAKAQSNSVDKSFYVSSPFQWDIGVTFKPNFLPALKLSLLNTCCMQEEMHFEFSPSFEFITPPTTTAATATATPAPSLSSPTAENRGEAKNASLREPDQLGHLNLTTAFALSVQISDSNSQWPTDWLIALGAPWNTLAPQGDLLVQTERVGLSWHPFSKKPALLSGQATLTLKDLSSRLSTLSPLGTYQIVLSQPSADNLDIGHSVSHSFSHLNNGSEPTPPRAQTAQADLTFLLKLSTLEGRLELTGDGSWNNAHLHFNGLARAAPGFEAALANLLGVLGPRHDNMSTLKIGFYEKLSQPIKA